MVNWSQYLALRAGTGFMHCFHAEQNLHTAAGVGTLFYRWSGRHRERAEQNLTRSFPEWSEGRVREVAERSMQNMFQMFLVDAMVMPRLITPGNWSNHIRLGDLRDLIDRLEQQRPALFITGHCGNWELLGYALSMWGYSFAALARPLDNPLINRWLLGVRQRHGLRIITKWGAIETLQDLLGRGGQVGFIADQNAGDQGLFVPFFGRLASSYKSIGLLAMRFNLPVIAGFARRINSRFQYEFSCTDIIEPADWADQPDPLYYITARYNRAMESMIRAAPEQYLWLHRRWKSRPKFERAGKPMPGKLREKIEQLPWMTQGELDRILDHSRVNP